METATANFEYWDQLPDRSVCIVKTDAYHFKTLQEPSIFITQSHLAEIFRYQVTQGEELTYRKDCNCLISVGGIRFQLPLRINKQIFEILKLGTGNTRQYGIPYQETDRRLDSTLQA